MVGRIKGLIFLHTHKIVILLGYMGWDYQMEEYALDPADLRLKVFRTGQCLAPGCLVSEKDKENIHVQKKMNNGEGKR
jgi:hypothetical protein